MARTRARCWLTSMVQHGTSWIALGISVCLLANPLSAQGRLSSERPPTVIGEIRHAGGIVTLRYEPGNFRVDNRTMLAWVRRSAAAVSVYFGRFPVSHAEIAIKPRGGAVAVGGRAWSEGVPSIRITLNRKVDGSDLAGDSVLVHEMTHLAIPDLPERHLWLHEGIATYVEFIARAQAGQTTPHQVWSEFVREMPAGLPPAGDGNGLDGSTGTDRVYWGGALFCLLADIEIRNQTGNRLGLQDALRALQAAGGSLSDTWSLSRILSTADAATGTEVLRRLYRRLGPRAGLVDLEATWRDLGIDTSGRRLRFDDRARLAAIRTAITSRPSLPLLVARPAMVGAWRRLRPAVPADVAALPRGAYRPGQSPPAYASPTHQALSRAGNAAAGDGITPLPTPVPGRQ